MTSDAIRELFPELHDAHMAFVEMYFPTLRSKLDELVHRHLVPAGFVVRSTARELVHESDDASEHLVSEIDVRLEDPATGAQLVAVAFVESDVTEEMFALENGMGVLVYQAVSRPDAVGLDLTALASLGVSASGKARGHDSTRALAELAAQDPSDVLAALQDALAP